MADNIYYDMGQIRYKAVTKDAYKTENRYVKNLNFHSYPVKTVIGKKSYRDILLFSDNNFIFKDGEAYHLDLDIPANLSYDMVFDIKLVEATLDEDNIATIQNQAQFQEIRRITVAKDRKSIKTYSDVILFPDPEQLAKGESIAKCKPIACVVYNKEATSDEDKYVADKGQVYYDEDNGVYRIKGFSLDSDNTSDTTTNETSNNTDDNTNTSDIDIGDTTNTDDTTGDTGNTADSDNTDDTTDDITNTDDNTDATSADDNTDATSADDNTDDAAADSGDSGNATDNSDTTNNTANNKDKNTDYIIKNYNVISMAHTWLAEKAEDYTHLDIVFSKKVSDSNFNAILIEMNRNVVTDGISFTSLKEEYSGLHIKTEYLEDGTLYDAEASQEKIIKQQCNKITNLITEETDRTKFNNIGVWSHPDSILAINGEEIRIGQSGYYELNDFNITNFGIVVKSPEDKFSLDYQYQVNDTNSETEGGN